MYFCPCKPPNVVQRLVAEQVRCRHDCSTLTQCLRRSFLDVPCYSQSHPLMTEDSQFFSWEWMDWAPRTANILTFPRPAGRLLFIHSSRDLAVVPDHSLFVCDDRCFESSHTDQCATEKYCRLGLSNTPSFHPKPHLSIYTPLRSQAFRTGTELAHLLWIGNSSFSPFLQFSRPQHSVQFIHI